MPGHIHCFLYSCLALQSHDVCFPCQVITTAIILFLIWLSAIFFLLSQYPLLESDHHIITVISFLPLTIGVIMSSLVLPLHCIVVVVILLSLLALSCACGCVSLARHCVIIIVHVDCLLAIIVLLSFVVCHASLLSSLWECPLLPCASCSHCLLVLCVIVGFLVILIVVVSVVLFVFGHSPVPVVVSTLLCPLFCSLVVVFMWFFSHSLFFICFLFLFLFLHLSCCLPLVGVSFPVLFSCYLHDLCIVKFFVSHCSLLSISMAHLPPWSSSGSTSSYPSTPQHLHGHDR